MDGEICIVSVDDRKAWDAAHRDGGLPSQSWRYAHALSASGIRPHLAIVHARGARMLMPFFQRTWGDRIDVATTIGLSGTTIRPASPAPLDAWRSYAASRGWVAGYVQLEAGAALKVPPRGDDLVDVNVVFSLDLRDERLLGNMGEIVRRKIRRAEGAGATLIRDRDVIAEALQRLYPRTMRRTRARPEYAFRAETLARWTGDPTSVVLGARLGGRVEAVSTFCVAGSRAEYHINASSERGRDLTAWLIWKAIADLRDRGVTMLNLGGGARPGDGVYRFKERFHGRRLPLRAVLQVYDPLGYEALCREAGADAGTGRFPAYRFAAAAA